MAEDLSRVVHEHFDDHSACVAVLGGVVLLDGLPENAWPELVDDVALLSALGQADAAVEPPYARGTR